ncbi:MAG: pro-sigmaK processing inhibitor BofA family protein [Clostridiales bacterium]|nr:pro-sigmaK processing inhibitor BofA family protein [Clostridiales bacterium]
MNLEILFIIIAAAVFFLRAKREKKAKIILNSLGGIVTLVIFNSLLSANIGYNIFSILMAMILGIPAVAAMALVNAI